MTFLYLIRLSDTNIHIIRSSSRVCGGGGLFVGGRFRLNYVILSNINSKVMGWTRKLRF